MIMEINWRYIVSIVKLVLELWVCMVEVIAISSGAVAALRCVESILLCIEVLGHIFMLVNHWYVVIVLSVVSVRLLLRLVVFLWDFLWVMSGLMNGFFMMDGLLFRRDGEVSSDSGFKCWLFVDRLDMAHFRFLLLFSRFVANWSWFLFLLLSLTLLTSQVKLRLLRHGHRHLFTLVFLLLESNVVITSKIVMD